jgi:hypothetical protein
LVGGRLGGGVGGGAEVAGCRGRKGGITVTASGARGARSWLPGKEGRRWWGTRQHLGRKGAIGGGSRVAFGSRGRKTKTRVGR